MTPPFPRQLARGVTRRCPRCGSGGLFRRWFRMIERCPRCGLRFEREEGSFTMALILNFAATEAVLAGWIVGAFAVTLPDPPVALIAGVAVAICVVVPLFCYPFSKTLWLAVHLRTSPPDAAEEADIAAHRVDRGHA